MSRLPEPKGENPSTYVVQDRGNLEEMIRLQIQDEMFTTSMGGVLPEVTDPTSLRRVLDVGCGAGGWLREVARTYPQIEQLVGIDISGTMVKHANEQAALHHIGERVQFKIMDALRHLDFSTGFFHLVNQRAGVSWLRTWEWKLLFLGYLRVTQPGGIIRITEPGGLESNSPALNQLTSISLKASYHSGRFFQESSDGLIPDLADLMRRHAVEEVQTQLHTLTYQANTVQVQQFAKDMELWYRVGLPFFQKWMPVPPAYQEIYQQALKEMHRPDFTATWTWLTAWGIRPRDGQPIWSRGLL